jgi:tetratricopeptide (TPR) repeat protein
MHHFLPSENRIHNEQNLNGLPKNADSASMLTFQNLGQLAEFCATRGDYPLAIEYYKHMTNLQPDNGPSWMALGHCCLLTDEIHQAFNAYQHALNCVEDIKDPQLWYGIGILYEKFESYDNAISALVGVLKMSPNFYQKSEVLYKLGVIFAKTNQINQAINYFQNSILTNSFTNKRKVDTLLKIGLLYEEKRDYV